MSSYAGGGHKDWAKYAFFNDLHYVRNFVDGNDEFELMVRQPRGETNASTYIQVLWFGSMVLYTCAQPIPPAACHGPFQLKLAITFRSFVGDRAKSAASTTTTNPTG